MAPDAFFMAAALAEARRGIARGDGGPFGVVIANKAGKILAKAHNTVLHSNNPTHHAEINAISQAAKKLSSFDLCNCTIYATCRPCMMCSGAIIWARIGRIVYGANSADAKKLGFREPSISDAQIRQLAKVQITSGVLRSECISLMAAWAQSPKKRLY
ncbi:MAG: nucleoside deaminase [Candidatus Micrarchaeia archaeon]|jgi:tRNA(Arg) A34 adenosine deaminase TadA